MKVSVVIPNYNGERYLKTCLDALSRQTFHSYETIVVDNGSNDGSCKVVENSYPSVKLLRLPNNYGFSRAVNEGIKRASGEYVVLLNNDTEVTEEWLSNLIGCIERNRNLFSCSSKMIRYHDREIIDDAGDEYTILGWAYKRGDGEQASKYSLNNEVFSSCAGAAIYRKEIFNEIGYFDERFFAYLEDVDICYRAKAYGYENMYCSNAIVYHVGSATSGGSKYNSFKVKLSARNSVYVVYKNMPILQLLLNLPFILLGHAIKLVFFYSKGFGKNYLQGVLEGITTLSNIDKIKCNHRNYTSYLKIEKELIRNTVSYLTTKLSKK